MRALWINLIALLMCASSACAQPLTIVDNGQPRASIVVRESALAVERMTPRRGAVASADEKVKFAALDLQKYILDMTGAELPLVSDAAAPEGALILVGTSKLTEKIAGLKVPSGLTFKREEEGLTIQLHGNHLVLAGNDAGPYFGTYYAVSEWLNRQGVRWIMPGEIGEVVPKHASIIQEPINLTQHPSFRIRMWWCNQPADMDQTEALWKLRNKMTISGNDLLAIPGDSHLRSYLPDAELAKTRPELFAKNIDGSPNVHMVNCSSAEMAQMVADKVIAAIKKADEDGRGISSLGFAPDDGLPMDFTPETMNNLHAGITDWVGRPGVPTEESISEEWFFFMNRVAENVAKVYPDFIITTNGYANRATPPEGIELHPNLGVMYAYIWADTTKQMNHPHSWHGQIVAAQMKRWAELSDYTFLYEYNLTMLVTALTPVPQTQKLAANMPMMADMGVIGFMNETKQPYMEEGLVTRYLRAKMMWDAHLDVEATLDDYYAQWYGPAATEAQAFWDAIEDDIQNSPMLGHEDRILPFVYTPELLVTLEKHCAAAEKLAKEEPYATRVKVDRLTLEHLKDYMAYKAAEFDGRWADAVAKLDHMVELRMQLNAISPFIAMPPSLTGIERYYSGDWYYGTLHRRDYFQELHDMTSGKTGSLVAMAPKQMKFKIDDTAVGKDLRWYAQDHDRSDWREIDTTKPYYIQGYLDERGVPYGGHMWYVFDIDVPAGAVGKPMHLYTPFVTCQAWAWVNGQYAGNRKYLDAYISPAPMDMDVTNLVKPGRNTIAVWVSTGLAITQAPEGILGRLFLYSPKPAEKE